MLSEERGQGDAEGREQPAKKQQGNPGQVGSSSGCLQPHTGALDCLWIKSKPAQNPPFPSAHYFPLSPPCLELRKCNSGVKPAQDVEQGEECIPATEVIS